LILFLIKRSYLLSFDFDLVDLLQVLIAPELNTLPQLHFPPLSLEQVFISSSFDHLSIGLSVGLLVGDHASQHLLVLTLVKCDDVFKLQLLV
jgi:hypothetical protein